MIVSTEILPDEALGLLREWNVKNGRFSDQDLATAKVLIAWPQKITKDTLRKARSLEAIQTLSAGVDDLPYSTIPGKIKLFSNADAYSVPVAEHAWGLALALAKGICKKEKIESRVLQQKNLVVLGCGGIGSIVASIGRGFKMHIIGLSRSFSNPENFDEKHYSLDQLPNLLTAADLLVCALPLNKSTRGLFKLDNLRPVKNGAIIVNVARAEIFDNEGTYKFLAERRDVRFGTDVFWRKDGREIFESKLWELSNFVGTKHTAGVSASAEVRNNAMIFAARNVGLYLKTGNANHEVRLDDYV